MVEDEVKFLKCVGNETRYEILRILEDGEKSVHEISGELEKEQSLVSHHLKSLCECNLIGKRRVGRKIMYKIADPSIHEFIEQVDELSMKFCKDTESKTGSEDEVGCGSNGI